MVQAELDYQEADTSLNIKLINPSPVDVTGIATVSLLQGITPTIAVGGEVIAQSARAGEPVETGLNLALRHKHGDSVATVLLQQFAALQLSYFYRVSERVELGTEMQMLVVGPRKDALTTLAAKFDYRQATIRAQADSVGKVALLYEEKLFPGFSFMVAGELDHVKGSGRFGVGINMEN